MEAGDTRAEQPPDAAGVRVVLVDDHELFRSGLRELLEERGVDVVAEAADGETAVEAVREAAPDVVVMDIAMSGMSGIEATKLVRATAPATKVIMLTVSADEHEVEDAIYAGACGYVLKSAAVEEIVAGIGAAAAGEALLSPRIAAGILERVRKAAPSPPESPASPLTEREREVLALMAEGKSNAEIADALFISPHTVKTHVSNILAKLEAQTRIEAAVKAARRRLL
jgi:DNA-binding NarL/FixJ family response regulator